MTWFIVILAVVVIGIAWVIAQGRLGGMPPLVDDRPGPDLADAAISGDDLRGLRLAVTMRGYSMEQVDALLDRLANQLDGQPFYPVDALDEWAKVEPLPGQPVSQDSADEPADVPPDAVDEPIDGQPDAGEQADGQPSDQPLASDDEAPAEVAGGQPEAASQV